MSDIGQGSIPTPGQGQEPYFKETPPSDGDLEQVGEMSAAEEAVTEEADRSAKAKGKKGVPAKKGQTSSAKATAAHQTDQIDTEGLDEWAEKLIGEINRQLGQAAAKARLPQDPALGEPDSSQVSQKWDTSSIMQLIAQVLGEIADLAFRDKKYEARLTGITASMRKENLEASDIVMQKMRVNAWDQRRKAKAAEKSMKATMITTTVFSSVAMLAMAPVLAPTMGNLIALYVAMTVTAGALMTSMAVTQDAERGNWIEQLIWDGDPPDNEMRMLVNMMITLAITLLMILAAAPALVGATVRAGQQGVMSSTQAAAFTAGAGLSGFAQGAGSTGALQDAIKFTLTTLGVDEEEAEEIAQWLSMVLLLIMAILAAGMMLGATGGLHGKASFSNTQRVAQQIANLGALVEAAGGLAGGIASIYSGIMHMQIAKLQEEEAELEFKLEMLQIIDEVLKKIGEGALQEIMNITNHAAQEMQKGNQIWQSLHQTSNAIHLQSGI